MLEQNIARAAASGGEALVAGAIFTIPAFMLIRVEGHGLWERPPRIGGSAGWKAGHTLHLRANLLKIGRLESPAAQLRSPGSRAGAKKQDSKQTQSQKRTSPAPASTFATISTVVKRKPRDSLVARRYFVEGRVQGVGFRWFVERVATDLGLTGYARNLADGRVEVYAIGPAEQLAELAARLWQGPRMADVRRVEEADAPVSEYSDFRIEYF